MKPVDKPQGADPEPGESTPDKPSYVELLLAGPPAALTRIEGVLVGTLVALEPGGVPLVDFPHNSRGAPVPARAAATVTPGDVGREVALLFEGGFSDKPIVMGLMFVPGAASTVPAPAPANASEPDRLVLEATREVVIRCGESSITLTRAGKILVKGTYVQTRSTGVNRILGASVEIN